MKTSSLITAAMLAASMTVLAQPATAQSLQDDVQACRAEMTAQNITDMSRIRLRFLSTKGNSQDRTVYVKAISKDGKPSFRFTCRLNKTQVVAINTDKRVQFAKR